MQAFVHACMHAYIRTSHRLHCFPDLDARVCTCMHTYINRTNCTNVCTCMHTYIHTYITPVALISIFRYTYMYMQACIHTYIHTTQTCSRWVKSKSQFGRYRYIHTYIHTYIRTKCAHGESKTKHNSVYIYIYTHTHTRTCIHTYTHMCIHTHTHTHTHTYEPNVLTVCQKQVTTRSI